MTRTTPMRHFVIIAAALAFGLCATDALSLEKFEFTETSDHLIGANPDISVETVAGDITYTGTDGKTATVEMTIRIRARDEAEAQQIRDEIEILIDSEDGLFDARVERPDNFHRWLRQEFGRDRRISVSFDIRGPRGAEGGLYSVSGDITVSHTKGMHVETVSGEVAIEDISGRLKVKSVSGEVEITDCAGPARVESVSGGVLVDGCGADLTAKSVSGSLDLRDVKGSVEASTVSGDITLKQVEGGVSASSVSGDLRVEHKSGDLDMRTTSGDIWARSSSADRLYARSLTGDIELAIEPAAIGQVSLKSFSGHIEADAPIVVRKHSRRRLVGTMGEGDGELKIETQSGDIVVSVL